MKNSDAPRVPSLRSRLYSVWWRHVRVYAQNLASNAFPPFLEPLIFLAGIGLGLGKYITDPIEGQQYIEYLSVGMLITSSMWTAAFECSYGTFIRLEYEKVYDGMLAAPITANNLILGEMLWAASKGFFFSLAVLVVVTPFGLVPLPHSLAAPLLGFVNAFMFAALSLYITSFVKTINHFNFYMTGLLSPMFFFAGVVFPVENLPPLIRPIAELVPLTHPVRLMRAVTAQDFSPILLWDLAYITLFTAILTPLALARLKKRLIS